MTVVLFIVALLCFTFSLGYTMGDWDIPGFPNIILLTGWVLYIIAWIIKFIKT